MAEKKAAPSKTGKGARRRTSKEPDVIQAAHVARRFGLRPTDVDLRGLAKELPETNIKQLPSVIEKYRLAK